MAGVVASNVRNQRAKSLSLKDNREEAVVSRCEARTVLMLTSVI